MTPEERRARGYSARALLEDDTLQSGWAEIEADIRAQWENSGTSWSPVARRKREGLWFELRLLGRLRQKLASYAAQGRE